jgi:hypothetical protein
VELLYGVKADPITIKRACGAKNVMPCEKMSYPAIGLAAGEWRALRSQLKAHTPNRPYFVSENSVGVLPVT